MERTLKTMINQLNDSKYDKFKRFCVVFKFTLARGYSWLNVFLIGFIAASQMKLLFPAYFSGLWKFFGLIIFATFGLWLIGYIDKKLKFLHVENSYGTETNPMMMELLNNSKKDKDESTQKI